jgi:hypothetical protein
MGKLYMCIKYNFNKNINVLMIREIKYMYKLHNKKKADKKDFINKIL